MSRPVVNGRTDHRPYIIDVCTALAGHEIATEACEYSHEPIRGARLLLDVSADPAALNAAPITLVWTEERGWSLTITRLGYDGEPVTDTCWHGLTVTPEAEEVASWAALGLLPPYVLSDRDASSLRRIDGETDPVFESRLASLARGARHGDS